MSEYYNDGMWCRLMVANTGNSVKFYNQFLRFCSTVYFDSYSKRFGSHRACALVVHFTLLPNIVLMARCWPLTSTTSRCTPIYSKKRSFFRYIAKGLYNILWTVSTQHTSNRMQYLQLGDIWLHVNKNPTRCSSMQLFIHCKVTLHVSGVTAPIIRSTKNCNRNLRYRS